MSNNQQTIPTATVGVDTLQQEVELLQKKHELQFAMSDEGRQLQLVRARQEAEFALTPVGQELQRFQTNQRMGQMYASSTIVPDTYKGNVANCAIACDVALRMNANALMVMQNLYMVHGMPSWSSKFLIATINTCGRFQPLRYEDNGLTGDDYGWRCYTYAADDRKKTERLEGPWVTWKTVKAEGWDQKKNSKWLTMPEQMFRYRAAAFWQRLYAPEISMGFNTVEESQDMATEVDYTEIHPDGTETTVHRAATVVDAKAAIAERARQAARQAAQTDAGVVQEVPQPAGQDGYVNLDELSDAEFDHLMDTFDAPAEYGPDTDAN